MWYLTSESESRIIYVHENKNVTIGRSIDAQNNNFAVPDDPSLSRKHATLTVKKGELVLRDLGSKYGTCLNNEVVTETDRIVKSGDVIKFGVMNCVWKVNQLQFISCTSTLKGDNLQTLKVNLLKLGGILKNCWDDSCYYLTMPAITLTIKVVLALVQGSHIVTTEYWKQCLAAIIKKGPLPSPRDYIPQIVEPTLNKEIVSFLPNEQRQKLFSGKTFIFFSRRQLNIYEVILLKSSATPLLLSECKITKSGLCEDNIVVIQYNITSTTQETQVQKEQIDNLVDYLKRKSKRIIPDLEIGLAILYCSTSKYCNPDFNLTSEVVKHVSSTVVKDNKILAPETQNYTHNTHKIDNVLVHETLNSENDISFDNVDSTSKRKLSIEMNDSSASKKRNTGGILEAKKRAAEDDLGNNSKKMALNCNNEDDGIFNFVTETNSLNDIDKRLNLDRPSKRKIINDDDDLFNFVGNKKPHSENEVNNVKVDTLRGIKLQELMDKNFTMPSITPVKKEDISDLNEKFRNIDIGSTTIIIKSDLIIKRVPVEIKTQVSGVKNFKKFKKVWPTKMKISLIC